jgi:hypothetical protein
LRLRLTLVFALAMAAVLAGVGMFVYTRLGNSLIEQLDRRLAVSADALAAAVTRGDVHQLLEGDEEEFAQVLTADGDVVAATAGFDAPLLSSTQRAAAADGTLLTDIEVSPPGEDAEVAITLPSGS